MEIGTINQSYTFMKTKLLIFLMLVVSINLSYSQQRAKSSVKTATKKTVSINEVKPPEPEVKPVQLEPGKDVVAIYPFTSASGYDYEYAQSVGNAIESGFVRSVRFNVVERNRFGSISQEERFKEVNTASVVKLAAKLGAKYIITGHITGASTNEIYTSDHKFDGYQTSINVAFKIIEVETSLIKASESLNITGKGGSTALAKGNAYGSIDYITRRIIASYFPQGFKFMSIANTEIKKKQEVLSSFKFWGGSDNGVKVGDVVEIYLLNYIVNPQTNKKIEERTNIGYATVTANNSGTTSTCEVYKPQKFGAQLLNTFKTTPDLVVIVYSGGAKPRGFFDF